MVGTIIRRRRNPKWVRKLTQNTLKALILETLIEIGLLEEMPEDYEHITDLLSSDDRKLLNKPIVIL